MRDIKFRGLPARGEKKEWVYGFITEPNGPGEGIAMMDTDNHGERWQVDMNTVGEYTGFKDKDGKEIYEGDILEFTDGSKVKCVAEYWLDGFSAKDLRHNEIRYTLSAINDGTRVVGNIYENPEILKEGKRK